MRNWRIDEKQMSRIRKVLDQLTRQRMRFKDLIDDTDIPKASLARILRFLRQLDIVTKDDENYWCRRDYVFVESSPREQDRLLKHSEWLIPGLEAVFKNPPQGRYGVAEGEIRSWKDAEDRRPFALQHLRSYPPIYDALIEYEKLKAKLEKLGDKKIGGLSIWECHAKAQKGEGWFRKHFLKKDQLTIELHETLREALQSSTWEETEYFTETLKKAFEMEPWVADYLEDFLAYKEFLETKKQMEEAYEKMSSGIQMLIFKIIGGRLWLRGTCDLCREKIRTL